MNTDRVVNTDRVKMPVMNSAKLEKQMNLLLEYVAQHALLPPGARFKYVTHEFISRIDEPTVIQLHLDLGGGNETSFDIPLEELRMFQNRRPPVGAPQAGASAAKPVSAPATTAPQVDWTSNREELFAQASILENEARRLVSMQMVNGRRQMQCRCMLGRQGGILCDHLQFVYATGWERGKLLDESAALTDRPICLPIGMGQVYVDLQADILLDDTRPAGKKRTGYVRISGIPHTTDQFLTKAAHLMSPFPNEIDHVILAPGEGTIKVIRYMESLLRGTEQYQMLHALSPTDASRDAFQQANLICKRVHRDESGRKLVAEFIAGIRPSNKHRESWMIACAYTVFMTGLCLPCWKASSADANVPVF